MGLGWRAIGHRAFLAAMLVAHPLLWGNTANALDCEATRDRWPWPGENWATEAPAGSAEALKAFETYTFPTGSDEATREGVRTNAVAVVREGRLVYGRYARGFAADRPHIAWSVTKSVLHGLYGRAVALGHLASLHEPAWQWVPGLREGGKERITLAHLFGMSSGLVWDESYEYGPLFSDVVAMLYTRGRRDMAGFAAGHRLAAEPGTRWSYKSGDSLILSGAMRGIVGEAAYPDFPWTALFEPLGMRSVTFERDGAGTFVGSSYLYLTAADLARFGLLYMADGCWAGQRLLPEGWVAQAGKLAPAQAAGEPVWRRAYGAHWWPNLPAGGETSPRIPEAGPDMLIATGHWGQRLYVLPSRDLVIARFADDRDGSFNDREFLVRALAAFAPAASGGS